MLLATETDSLPVIERNVEQHGKDEIIVIVYEKKDCYTYSVQCRLGSFVRSVYPHSITAAYPTARAAKYAAALEIRQWTKKSRAAKNRLQHFNLLRLYHPELPFGF